MVETSGEEPTVRLRIDQGVAWIWFDNDRRLNALTAQMWEELPTALDLAQSHRDVRAIVLRGAGEKAFSAGADISEFETARTGEAAEHYNQLNHDAFLALERCEKPTIAMIHGFCLGGGLGLAVSCDLRICDEAATFSIPAARLGIGYHPRWVQAILRAIAAPAAKELLFTGARFDARWALRTGLVNSVCPVDDLEASVGEMALQICGNAPLSLKAAKRSIDALAVDPMAGDNAELVQLISDCFASEDYAEGRRAFEEKRKPVFKGR